MTTPLACILSSSSSNNSSSSSISSGDSQYRYVGHCVPLFVLVVVYWWCALSPLSRALFLCSQHKHTQFHGCHTVWTQCTTRLLVIVWQEAYACKQWLELTVAVAKDFFVAMRVHMCVWCVCVCAYVWGALSAEVILCVSTAACCRGQRHYCSVRVDDIDCARTCVWVFAVD